MKKHYALDSNIILANPQNLFGFDDNIVILTGTTLQELDHKKNTPGEVGYQARECCRILDELRLTGNLLEGVELKNGGTLIVEPDGVKQEYLPDGFSVQSPDNRIISTCIHLNKTKLDVGEEVILVTNDISMRVNASICGIKVEGYRNDKIEESGYTGHQDIDVPPEVIDQMYKDGFVQMESLKILHLLPNQFVTLKSGSQSALSIYKADGRLQQVLPQQKLFGWVKPMNEMQAYAMYALMAPAEEIPLVIMRGSAGTAKTFLSLAAGLDQTYVSQKPGEGRYYKMLIGRPNAQTSDPGFGYLPGSLEEKMTPLLAPYFDNLESLLNRRGELSEDHSQIQMQIDEMFDSGIIEVCPLNFIRGRSLQNAYIICDEAQNANRSLIRDLITRAGKGTKVAICGDIDQIDAVALDRYNNGLTYAIESMKGSQYTAIIEFEKRHSVRSDLAKDAIKRMKVGR